MLIDKAIISNMNTCVFVINNITWIRNQLTHSTYATCVILTDQHFPLSHPHHTPFALFKEELQNTNTVYCVTF